MIGMQIACDEAKGHRLTHGPLNLAHTEHPCGVPREEQNQEHFRGIQFTAARSTPRIECREVQLRHTVYHETREMVGRQTITQAHGQIERLVQKGQDHQAIIFCQLIPRIIRDAMCLKRCAHTSREVVPTSTIFPSSLLLGKNAGMAVLTCCDTA